MRKFVELQAFKIFMLWVHHALWCSCCSVSVILVSIVVLVFGVVVFSLCCLCRYRPFSLYFILTGYLHKYILLFCSSLNVECVKDFFK